MNVPAADGSPRPDSAPPAEPHAENPGTAAPPTFVRHVIRTLGLLTRRRRFILDRRGQLRAVFLTGSATAILLALLNMALYLARERDVAALLSDSPVLRDLIVAAAASLLFLAGVVVVTLIETHRTAGAAFTLARHMASIQVGRYDVELRLRKGDNLRELEGAFNEMAGALRERTLNEARELEELAAAAEALAGPDEAAQLAETIRERAREARSLVG
jgi:hypothetical protein